MDRSLFFILFCLTTTLLNAQEQLGLRIENFAGSQGIFLNPAAQRSNPNRIDINLVGAGIFIDNNYGYIQNTTVGQLISNRETAEFFSAPTLEDKNIPENSFIFDYNRDGRRRNGIYQLDIVGPSFTFSIGERHSVGAFLRYRQMFSTQDIPNVFSYYQYDAFPLQDEFIVDEFGGAFMTWSEIGLNYSYTTKGNEGRLDIGVSLKYLQGHDAAFFNNNQRGGYTKIENQLVTLGNPDVSFGYTTNNLNIGESGSYDLDVNGRGLGIDLGVMYRIDDYDLDYRWKFGLAILDLGYVRFNQNTTLHRVQVNGNIELDGEEFDDLTEGSELEEAVQIFSQQLLGDPNASLNGNSFSIFLPTAFNLQADYAFNRHLFINGLWIQRIPLGDIPLKRANTLAVTPRMEHQWIGASVPFILHNWQDFRVGLAIRLAYITVGTDNLGSWTRNDNLSGTDLYVALKIGIPQLSFNEKKKKKNTSHRRKGRNKVKCYF